MQSQQDRPPQAPDTSRLSIADKCAVSYYKVDDTLVEYDGLAAFVSSAIGAYHKTGTRHPSTPADELAQLLTIIKTAIDENEDRQKVRRTLDAAVELAFLHTPVYRMALELYRLEQSQRSYDAHPYEVLSAALDRARAGADQTTGGDHA